MSPALAKVHRVHDLQLQTEFELREIAGCEEPLAAIAPNARAAQP